MNKIISIILVFICLEGSTQMFPSAIDTTQYSKSMSEVSGKRSDGMYRYFENGIAQPFEGILYAKYDNGYFKSWQEFQKGIGEGHWINFYENGNMKEWGTYDQNKVEGPIRKYHANGKLKAEGTYREWRVRIGKWDYYDEEGMLVSSEDYGIKGDLRDVEFYYESGQIPERWYRSILDANLNFKKD